MIHEMPPEAIHELYTYLYEEEQEDYDVPKYEAWLEKRLFNLEMSISKQALNSKS